MRDRHAEMVRSAETTARHDTLAEQLAAVRRDEFREEPGPCKGCASAEKCGAGGLACVSFALFVDNPQRGAARWKVAPRQPSAEIFQKLFG